MRYKLNFRDVNWKLTAVTIYLRLRRELLIHLRPKYVIRKLMLRRGGCKHCSCCASLARTPFKCEKVGEAGNKCSLYDSADFPVNCYLYPVDEVERDLMDKTLGFNCGFKWLDEPKIKQGK